MLISDTDFLSSFAKIGKIELILKVFKAKEIVITKAVLEELKKSTVFDSLSPYFSGQNQRIVVKDSSTKDVPDYFGIGERASITLAKKHNAKLIMDDADAGRYAESIGVKVIDVPAFLFYCRKKKILSRLELERIINDLKEKIIMSLRQPLKEIF